MKKFANKYDKVEDLEKGYIGCLRGYHELRDELEKIKEQNTKTNIEIDELLRKKSKK